MVAEESDGSMQGFHFFDDISRLMVSERADRQGHGIIKVCFKLNHFIATIIKFSHVLLVLVYMYCT